MCGGGGVNGGITFDVPSFSDALRILYIARYITSLKSISIQHGNY